MNKRKQIQRGKPFTIRGVEGIFRMDCTCRFLLRLPSLKNHADITELHEKYFVVESMFLMMPLTVVVLYKNCKLYGL
jgi:hypothetical protein